MKKEKTIHELVKEFPDKTYRELEIYREKDREQEAGVCVMGEMRKDREEEKEIDYHRYWKNMYEKEHKLRQEAEGEMTIVKGIGQNSPEMKSLRARVKELGEINESHRRYNGKLQKRLKEVEMDNKKMALQIEDKINQMRRSGM